MKQLFEKIFHKKDELTYVFAEYQPAEIRNGANAETYTINLLEGSKQNDEMLIDNIYQSL